MMNADRSDSAARMSNRLIYGLTDPRTNEIHYVGSTMRGLARAAQHKSETPRHARHQWIAELVSAGIQYGVVVLEDDPADLCAAERSWIARGRAEGWPLTNKSAGGPGMSGVRHGPNTITKMRESAKKRPRYEEQLIELRAFSLGKPKSQEVRAKISAAKTGVPGHRRTPEQRAAASERMRGRAVSEEQRAKISATLSARALTAVVSAETRAKISAGLRGKPKPPFTEEHRRNLSEAMRRRFSREQP